MAKWQVALALLLSWTMLGGVAHAMPGDPPIEPLTPADGAVLAPDPSGVAVTFTCPTFRFTDDGAGLALFAGREYYSLRVSSSSQLDADGRLAAAFAVDQAAASSDPARPAGECFSAFTDGSASGAHTKPGTYYWQVFRICTACGGYEVGPVRSFRIAVQTTPTVALRWKPWAGYGVVADVRADGVPDGAAITVQRQTGKAWTDAASGFARGGRATVDLELPKAGATAVRAVVVVGDQRIEGTATSVAVGKVAGARRATGAADDRRWQGQTSSNAPITFTVSGRGSKLGKLAGRLTVLCPAAVPGQFIPQLEAFGVPSAKIAPDGRFLKTTRSKDGKLVVRVAGRLKAGKLRDGEISWTDGLCTGTGTFTAKR
jgi:hypothetical protein